MTHAEPEAADRLAVADAAFLPFGDGAFKAAISINTVHNLDRDLCVTSAHVRLSTVAAGLSDKPALAAAAARAAAERELIADPVGVVVAPPLLRDNPRSKRPRAPF